VRLRDRLESEDGYTLVELLITMSILTLVLGAVVTLFVQGSHAEADLNLRFQAQTQARVALDRMRRELHGACSVTASTSSSATFVLASTTTPATCSVNVTWCVRGSGSRWGLYRVAGGSCTGGTRYADYLLNPTTPSTAPALFFDYRAPSAASHNLASIGISLPVNVKPSRATDLYRLEGNVVLRNGGRL
jgi:prepilin-type N-terminal cleavage/methylation domain-containing protein